MDALDALLPLAGFAIWYFVGRSHGKATERKRASALTSFAALAFGPIVRRETDRVVVDMERLDDDHYTARLTADVPRGDATP